MKKLLGAIGVVTIAGSAWWMIKPSGFDTANPLVSDGTPISLLNGFDPERLTEGWVHRTFMTVSAADYQMVQEDGAPALRCTTDNTASILARDTQIAVGDLPYLSWQWKVTQPIESDVDEATKEGDDHPARFFLVFSNEAQDRTAMEIIWSNRTYQPGDYKIIGDFYHYVANGLPENSGTWHSETVDLQQIYSDIGGTGVPTLQTLGFFCDSDNTGTQSEAFFREVTLSAEP